MSIKLHCWSNCVWENDTYQFSTHLRDGQDTEEGGNLSQGQK